MKTRYICFLAFSILTLLLVGCTAGPNPSVAVPDAQGSVAGFWLGLWHGIIAPVTFIISLFTQNVQFYDVHNSGWPYNLGFVLGAGIIGGGGIKGACRRKEKSGCM